MIWRMTSDYPTEITLKPIGVVHSPCKTPDDLPRGGGACDVRAVIEIAPEYAEGIADMAVGDRVMVLFYFHLSREVLLTVPIRGTGPMTGVFSTHSPTRPNFIGVTEVLVESIDGPNLGILGADMLDGTPILDMKPAPKNNR